MDNTLEILDQVPLFNGLNEDELRQVKSITVDKLYNKGKTIFTEGDEASGFYIVAAGKVKIFKLSMEGKEKILHIYGPGHPFGEVPVFAGSRFPANAETLLKSHLLFLPRQRFIDLIGANPSLAINMLGVMSMRLREFAFQIESLSLKEVPGRLAGYLLYLAGDQNRSPRMPENQVTLTISKGQLASLLGTIPETLSRIFSKMSQQNLISVKGKEIGLIDMDGLEALSETGKLME